MFANAVFNYNMSKNVEKITKKSNKRIKAIIPDIISVKRRCSSTNSKLMQRVYQKEISKVHSFDRELNINTNCVSCNICRDVCPAKNIEMKNNRPTFLHQCESCLACLHHCPKKAINYAEKPQNRRRYTHPEIGFKEISQHYK